MLMSDWFVIISGTFWTGCNVRTWIHLFWNMILCFFKRWSMIGEAGVKSHFTLFSFSDKQQETNKKGNSGAEWNLAFFYFVSLPRPPPSLATSVQRSFFKMTTIRNILKLQNVDFARVFAVSGVKYSWGKGDGRNLTQMMCPNSARPYICHE